MKSFLRSLLATVVGIFISFLFIIIFLVVMIASQEKEVKVKPKSVLLLDLAKPIVDRQPKSTINLGAFGQENKLGLNQILKSIQRAKTDNNILGIYIETPVMATGFATTEEIRSALLDFKTSGKFVVAYSDVYTQSAYYLATAADKVFYNPSGFFMVNGLRIQTMHLKNTFEKLKIEPTVIKIGKYKGAGELFEFDQMSAANREQLERVLGNIWDNISENISKSRDIEKDSLDYIINNMLLKDPSDVLKYGLVDSLIYKGDVINYLKALTNTKAKDDLTAIRIGKYAKVPGKKAPRGSGKNKIAVIYASGEIVNAEGDSENVGGGKYAREIRKARADSNIKAIVLRVNSPGGSAMASDAILEEIWNTKGVKPIVVSMGDLAASGGYYISCGADKIIAGKNTITGSIGVISVFFNAQKFFNNFGVNFDIAKTHNYADFMSANRPASETEQAYWKHFTEYTYDQFLKNVAKGRNLEYNQVHEVAQGRVWDGMDAKEKGLVDAFGGLRDAVVEAAKLAKLGEGYRVVELPKKVDPIEQLIKELSGETKIQKTLEPLGLDEASFYSLKSMLENQGTVARLPYAIKFW